MKLSKRMLIWGATKRSNNRAVGILKVIVIQIASSCLPALVSIDVTMGIYHLS